MLSLLPVSLRIFIGTIIFIAFGFIVSGFYFYHYKNGTSWNFGAMGMYTKIDYPGIRWLKIYSIDQQSGLKLELDSNYARQINFKEYESFISLPSAENAKNLIFSSFANYKTTIFVEVWTFRYDSKNHSVKKILLEKHAVKNNDSKTNK